VGAARTANGRVIALALEVTDAVQIAQAAARVEEEAARPGASPRGGLDALVDNAGIGVGGPLELISLEDLRRQFEVNVFAQVAVTQAMLPALRRAGGRIVFVSSIGGRVAMAFTAPYAASKHAAGAGSVRPAHAGGGYTASQANRLVVAACVCSIPGSASIAGSVAPFQESR
jgi:NAD(P)-dependent dehydrogenase (short-subunit alcohol dehydrogenase family)